MVVLVEMAVSGYWLWLSDRGCCCCWWLWLASHRGPHGISTVRVCPPIHFGALPFQFFCHPCHAGCQLSLSQTIWSPHRTLTCAGCWLEVDCATADKWAAPQMSQPLECACGSMVGTRAFWRRHESLETGFFLVLEWCRTWGCCEGLLCLVDWMEDGGVGAQKAASWTTQDVGWMDASRLAPAWTPAHNN